MIAPPTKLLPEAKIFVQRLRRRMEEQYTRRRMVSYYRAKRLRSARSRESRAAFFSRPPA